MAVTVDEGAAWLEGLAAQYEEAASRLRETARMIRDLDAHGVSNPGAAVPVREAIRMVLGQSGRPLRASEVWEAIRTQRIALVTRSGDPRNLVNSTLTAMESSRQVRREDGGWVLA